MANQQITEVDNAYIAGLIDGEGCITICKTHRKELGPDRCTYSPRVLFANTNEEIVNAYLGYLKSMKIAYWINADWKRKGNRRHAWNISVGGMPGQKKLLMSVLPYLKGKKALAEILLEYIDRRMMRNGQQKNAKRIDENGRFITSTRARHDEHDVRDFETVRSIINHRNLRDLATPMNPELDFRKVKSTTA